MTRAEAIESGAVRYSTGRPCLHGHVCERYTASKNCVQCHARNALKGNRAWRLTNAARMAYLNQETKAAARGIQWLFTFDSWWELWGPHYANRGRAAESLCMARTGDTGPYAPDNVRITTNTANHQERETLRRERAAAQ